jgi:hypothetical protein
MSGTTQGTAQSLGILKATWGSQPLAIDTKSSKFTLGGPVYTAVVAGTQITQAQGYMAPDIMMAFPLNKGMSIASLKALNGQTLVLTADSGQTYTFNGAFIVGDVNTKAGAGSNVSVKMSGQAALEVVPSA